MPTPKSDLYVITAAKRLADYVSDLNERAPKKFWRSAMGRADKECLEIVTRFYLANSYRAGDIRRKDA